MSADNVELTWMVVASIASIFVGIGSIVEGFRSNRDMASQIRDLYAESISNRERIAIVEAKIEIASRYEEGDDEATED